MTADQVLVMVDGRVVWRGHPTALLTMAEEARAWGISLPPATEVATELGIDRSVIANENELVAALWK